MRIAFLAPHLRVSGGVRILLTYASHLAKNGHDVTVYVRSNNRIRRVIANTFQLGKPTWISGFRARVIRISDMTPDCIPPSDAIVATTWQTALALNAFPKGHGRQYYLVQHDEGLYHGDRSRVDEALALPQKKIAVSSWLGHILSERYGQKAELLINPVDTHLFHQVPRTTSAETIRILLLHHTYPWKGTAEGAELIKAAKKRHPEVRFIVFGVRSEDAADLGCDEYHYDLPQEKLAELYSNTDIYLCPSWEEGYGLPSVEAMHCGAALVTYDNGGSQDYAKDGETAFVAPHRDTPALGRKLEEAISDPVQRARIAQRGKAFVKAMPGWEEQTAVLERILAS